MKHGEGRDKAFEMYVYHQMTFDEIARQTGRTEKTIRKWADDGGWREKRDRDLTARITIHEQLHTFLQKLTEKTISDCAAGEDVSFQRIHAINSLAKTISTLYKYERTEATNADADNKEQSVNGLSPEKLAKIEKMLNIL